MVRHTFWAPWDRHTGHLSLQYGHRGHMGQIAYKSPSLIIRANPAPKTAFSYLPQSLLYSEPISVKLRSCICVATVSSQIKYVGNSSRRLLTLHQPSYHPWAQRLQEYRFLSSTFICNHWEAANHTKIMGLGLPPLFPLGNGVRELTLPLSEGLPLWGAHLSSFQPPTESDNSIRNHLTEGRNGLFSLPSIPPCPTTFIEGKGGPI